ncbi:beta-ketoacyl-[acyl-carrier-protein] synthase family protein [Ferviditalea candida]|uniref:3-oxoacyl-[acyl-carrier-protein] synthase 2 n=1 Tax=Ferviditalea candida TaxID=3108399 RepID=A0ABU5ZJE0_9BACL|nr:beta-ketoacyl-[acyl-carrier-protein] synthase family protein [Paenibacillaceae bacterium T2]
MRIAVTGCGAATPFGMGAAGFWSKLIAGESAVRLTEPESYRKWTRVAASVPAFDPTDYLPRKLAADTDKYTHLALIAAAEAFADAGFRPHEPNPFGNLDPDRIGVALGTSFGGVQTLEAGCRLLAGSDSARISPRLVPKSIVNAAAGAIAIRWGIQGTVMSYSTACASSANSIGEACYWLKRGEADVVLAGGSESLFTPSLLAGLNAAGALAKSGPDDFSRWSRPFDRDRAGMVMGEGAAFLVLEPLDRAVSRGARVYAEFKGYGTSNDAYHETAPHPEGRGAALAMQRALRNTGVQPTDIGYINAHATSTPAGDAAEGAALHQVFGDALAKIPVSSIKGAVGHLLGAAGALESLATIMALDSGILPATLNCDHPDTSAPPDVIPHQARHHKVSLALSNSFGFGGQNASLVWARYR